MPDESAGCEKTPLEAGISLRPDLPNLRRRIRQRRHYWLMFRVTASDSGPKRKAGSMPRPSNRSQQFFAKLTASCRQARASRVEDHIKVTWDLPAGSSKYLPHQAFYTIPLDGSSYLAGDRNTQAMVRQLVFPAEENKTFRGYLPTSVVDGPEFRAADDSVSLGKSLGRFSSHSPSAFSGPWPAAALKPDGRPWLPFWT